MDRARESLIRTREYAMPCEGTKRESVIDREPSYDGGSCGQSER